MPDIMGKSDYSDINSAFDNSTITKYEVDSGTIDEAKDSLRYTNNDFKTWLGYYQKIPELKASIDAKAYWTIGKGFKANAIVSLFLNNIKGCGNDTFNTIIENMIRTYHIGGDAFAEIIRDDTGNLINLKPLTPDSVTIVYNKKGMISHYEQTTKLDDGTFKVNFKADKDKILHLSRNRLCSEIHGTSLIPAIEDIIKFRNQAMADWNRVLHRNIEPLWIFHMDTDDDSQIAKFKAKMDYARGNGENMYVPKGAVVPEQVGTATNSTLNPLPTIDAYNQYFFQATGVPDIILGGSRNFTEASAKISYLAFQQTIEEEQLYIESQIGLQLGMAIELTFPASLENELLSDKKKDVQNGITQPNEMQPTIAPTQQQAVQQVNAQGTI